MVTAVELTLRMRQAGRKIVSAREGKHPEQEQADHTEGLAQFTQLGEDLLKAKEVKISPTHWTALYATMNEILRLMPEEGTKLAPRGQWRRVLRSAQLPRCYETLAVWAQVYKKYLPLRKWTTSMPRQYLAELAEDIEELTVTAIMEGIAQQKTREAKGTYLHELAESAYAGASQSLDCGPLGDHAREYVDAVRARNRGTVVVTQAGDEGTFRARLMKEIGNIGKEMEKHPGIVSPEVFRAIRDTLITLINGNVADAEPEDALLSIVAAAADHTPELLRDSQNLTIALGRLARVRGGEEGKELMRTVTDWREQARVQRENTLSYRTDIPKSGQSKWR